VNHILLLGYGPCVSFLSFVFYLKTILPLSLAIYARYFPWSSLLGDVISRGHRFLGWNLASRQPSNAAFAERTQDWCLGL